MVSESFSGGASWAADALSLSLSGVKAGYSGEVSDVSDVWGSTVSAGAEISVCTGVISAFFPQAVRLPASRRQSIAAVMCKYHFFIHGFSCPPFSRAWVRADSGVRALLLSGFGGIG